MAGFKSRFIVGLALVVLALPAMVAAQSSTLIVPFDRTGTPGTKTITIIDPLTGQATTEVVDTGAFDNPCTAEFVDVVGTATIQTLQTIDKFGTVKVNVSEVIKSTSALGWVPDPLGAPIFTGSTYTFNESQQFTFRLPTAGLVFSSDFTDRIAMKGAKSTDNWVIRARFRIKIDSTGAVQVFLIKMNADACKG